MDAQPAGNRHARGSSRPLAQAAPHLGGRDRYRPGPPCVVDPRWECPQCDQLHGVRTGRDEDLHHGGELYQDALTRLTFAATFDPEPDSVRLDSLRRAVPIVRSRPRPGDTLNQKNLESTGAELPAVGPGRSGRGASSSGPRSSEPWTSAAGRGPTTSTWRSTAAGLGRQAPDQPIWMRPNLMGMAGRAAPFTVSCTPAPGPPAVRVA